MTGVVAAAPTVDAPRLAAVGDSAVLVEFGSVYADEVHDAVLALDRSIAARTPDGVIETVPAYVSLLVRFDPLITDHGAVAAEIASRRHDRGATGLLPPERVVEICYDPAVAPELDAVAERVGRSVDALAAAHLASSYRVVMYGFAPGSAYLAGVPQSIQVPRKPAATSRLEPGSVIVAGPQCLIATTAMPTGWWVIGSSPTPIMRPDDERPFLFDAGDRVRFERIDLATYGRRLGDP